MAPADLRTSDFVIVYDAGGTGIDAKRKGREGFGREIGHMTLLMELQRSIADVSDKKLILTSGMHRTGINVSEKE
jgi:hypothetical protein